MLFSSKRIFLLWNYPKITLVIILLTLAAIGGYYTGKYSSTHDDSFERKHTLLNITNFYFIHNPTKMCSQIFQKGNNKTILSVIHSERLNFLSRQIIRKTYGSINTYRGWSIQFVFVVGMGSPTEREMLEYLLEKEFIQYGDIIMGNFEDTYRNLPYKHLMGYKWAIEFCPQVNYYFKADDDVILDIFHAIDFLSSNISMTMYKDYYCYIYTGTEPVRILSKWKVTLEEYSRNNYPDYCGFAAYIVGMEAVKKIMSVTSKDYYLFIDDVFVTGLLRELANQQETLPKNKINLINVGGYSMGYNGDIKKLSKVIREQKFLTFIEENRTPKESCHIWSLILDLHGFGNVYVSTCNSLL